MSHWLVELPIPTPATPSDPESDPTGADHHGEFVRTVRTILGDAGGDIVDLQASADPARLFVVVAAGDAVALGSALTQAGLDHDEPAAVRLVGAELDDLPSPDQTSRWLVEWDLPEGLTMDAYLERKAANSPRYADVPEVRFQRTWVREDMDKCLCFYDGPDEEAIRHARDVVGAPVDRLHVLDGKP